MPTFAVRYKGFMTQHQRERLAAAGIQMQGRESSVGAGQPGAGMARTGRPVYTVTVEADSEDEAVAKVREAMEPDSFSFSDWEAGPL